MLLSFEDWFGLAWVCILPQLALVHCRLSLLDALQKKIFGGWGLLSGLLAILANFVLRHKIQGHRAELCVLLPSFNESEELRLWDRYANPRYLRLSEFLYFSRNRSHIYIAKTKFTEINLIIRTPTAKSRAEERDEVSR